MAKKKTALAVKGVEVGNMPCPLCGEAMHFDGIPDAFDWCQGCRDAVAFLVETPHEMGKHWRRAVHALQGGDAFVGLSQAKLVVTRAIIMRSRKH